MALFIFCDCRTCRFGLILFGSPRYHRRRIGHAALPERACLSCVSVLCWAELETHGLGVAAFGSSGEPPTIREALALPVLPRLLFCCEPTRSSCCCVQCSVGFARFWCVVLRTNSIAPSSAQVCFGSLKIEPSPICDQSFLGCRVALGVLGALDK